MTADPPVFVYEGHCEDCDTRWDRTWERPCPCPRCGSENVTWWGVDQMWAGLL